MASITGRITSNNKQILEVDAIPSAAGGTPAEVGSVALLRLPVFESTRFTFSQSGSFYDVSGAAKAIQLYNYPAVGHYFWFNVVGGSNTQTDPALVGTGHQVDILPGDTSAQIATKFFNAVNLVVDVFTATNGVASQVDVTNATAGNATDASVSGTAAAMTILQQGSDLGYFYLKVGPLDTDWDAMPTATSGVNVGLGAYRRLAIYDTNSTGYHVDDTLAQNGFDIDVRIVAQPTRSAAITYTIPNPGDAVTAADFVLTEGAQTINGDKTFGNNVVIQGNLTVNGTLTYINTTNLEVTDKLVTLNKGGAAASAGGSGLEFEENSVITAYFKQAADRLGWDFKDSSNGFVFNLDQSLMTADRKISVPDSAGVFVVRPTGTPGVAGQIAYFSDANNVVSAAGLTWNNGTSTLTATNIVASTSLTVSTFTAGSVIFAGASGLLSQNNANFFWDNSNARLGLGTATPSRRLDVNGTSLFRGAIRYADAGAANANWEVFQSQVSTTDATVTTISTVAIPTNSAVLVEFRIIGRRTGGSAGSDGDASIYVRTVRAKNVGGTVTIHHLQTDYTSEDQNGWNGTVAVSGTNIIATVKGKANNNINWTSTYMVQTLG